MSEPYPLPSPPVDLSVPVDVELCEFMVGYQTAIVRMTGTNNLYDRSEAEHWYRSWKESL